MVGSVGLGLLYDALFETTAQTTGLHEHSEPWWAIVSAGGLSLLFIRYAIDDGYRWLTQKRMQQSESSHLVFNVEGMTCGGCVSKLETALRKASGIDEAVVTLDPGQAMIRGTANREDVHTLIEQSGFQVVTST